MYLGLHRLQKRLSGELQTGSGSRTGRVRTLGSDCGPFLGFGRDDTGLGPDVRLSESWLLGADPLQRTKTAIAADRLACAAARNATSGKDGETTSLLGEMPALGMRRDLLSARSRVRKRGKRKRKVRRKNKNTMQNAMKSLFGKLTKKSAKRAEKTRAIKALSSGGADIGALQRDRNKRPFDDGRGKSRSYFRS